MPYLDVFSASHANTALGRKLRDELSILDVQDTQNRMYHISGEKPNSDILAFVIFDEKMNGRLAF